MRNVLIQPPRTATPVRVVYLEDDPAWAMILTLLLEQRVRDLFELIIVETTIMAEQELTREDVPTIFISDIDLRRSSGIGAKSTVWLKSIYQRLVDRGVEVFILSGYLDETELYILAAVGLQESRILDKSAADVGENASFFTELIDTILRFAWKPIDSIYGNQTEKPASLSFRAQFQNVHNSIFYAGQWYDLRITIDVGENSVDIPPDGFDIEIVSDNSVIKPQHFLSMTVGPSGIASKVVQIYFERKPNFFIDANLYCLNKWVGKVSFRNFVIY